MVYLLFFTACCLLGSATGEWIFEYVKTRYLRRSKRRD